MLQNSDKIFMQRCLQLAENGLGLCYPNPLVGSVIVHDGIIIGEGYHQKAGEAHAEVNAVIAVKNKELLKKSTLYVNLEPCAHVGRTPACSKMIIDLKIPRVVIGCRDSFVKVAGKGIEMMKNAGVEVVEGILEEKSRAMNRRFFTYHEKKRPYIILKWARTLDGFIDFERSAETPVKPNWITDEYARMLVHKWRSEESAVMAATNTILKDNPRLNVRDWVGHQPVRIVLDRLLRLNGDLYVFDDSQKTLVFTEKEKKGTDNTEYIQISFGQSFYKAFFNVLYEREIQSVFVEGGAELIQNLINRNYWDEAREFIGNVHFYSGIKSPVIPHGKYVINRFENNNLLIYNNTFTL